MDARLVDPRVDARWETEPTHAYRVVFWRQQIAPPGIPQEHMMWVGAEHDVAGAEDVHEVIAWADAEAQQRQSTYTLYAMVDRDDDRGLVWLAGVDPTSSASNFERPQPTSS